MAEATAVAETPVVKTDPQAAPPTETQAPVITEGTEKPASVQTETAPETPTEEATPPAEPESVRLNREAREADRAAIREEERANITRELTETRLTEKQKRSLQAFHDSFGTTAQRIRGVAQQLTIVDTAGETRNLTPQEINSLFVAPWEAHNGFVLGTKEEELNTPVALAAERVLKKDVFDKFADVASGKSIDDWLIEFAEHKWDDTKGAKGMTLERASEISTKARSEHKKLLADLAEANEKVKALQDKYGPEGDPLKNGNTRASGAGSISNERENNLASHEGRITPQQWKENDDRIQAAKRAAQGI